MKRIAPFALPLLAGTGPVLKPRSEPTLTIREPNTRNEYQAPGFDANADTIETSWNTLRSPRFRERVRSRLEVEIVLLANGGCNVRTRSRVEVTNSRTHPGDADQADWVGAGGGDRHQDRGNEPAMKFHRLLKFRLFGLNA